MTRKIRFLIPIIVIALLASACNLGTQRTLTDALPSATAAPAITLAVQADTSLPFNTVGQTVQYKYNVANTGGVSLPGFFTFTGAIVACPDVKTVGNLNTSLDPGEAVICSSTSTVTQADLDRGFITSVVSVNVSGTISNQATTTVATVPAKLLTLTKTANPTTYDRAGTLITYTYVIKNSGSQAIGPGQFTVTDTGIPTPINCGDANLTLAPNATVTCNANYLTTQADMGLTAIATNATASGGGVGPSQPASAPVTKGAVAPTTPAPAVNLTPGTTIQHTVVSGEWLWQIARCYGVDPLKLIQANPQLPNPAAISPSMVITVPNIGSAGKLYGPPCVVIYVVQSGDTWSLIAQKYNADTALLQMVNPGGLTPGSTIKVPRNSAGANISITPIPTTATTTPVNATRINFNPDGSAVTQNGTATSRGQPVRFVFTATQGQVLNLKANATANSISVAVYAPDGTIVKPDDLSPVWSGPLPASGDYRIEIVNALETGNSPFTLDVNLFGKCIDVPRTVRQVGLTHFNICGQLDASGKLKVIMIHILSESGVIKQDLAMPIDVLTPLTDQSSFIVEDLNTDTNDDFRIINSPATGTPVYLHFLYNPTTKKFEYNGIH